MMPKGQPGTLTHGLGAYTSGRCKCDVCRDAYMQWRHNRYGIKPRDEYLAAIEPPHGTESRYSSRKWACACEACREASAKARRGRRERNGVPCESCGTLTLPLAEHRTGKPLCVPCWQDSPQGRKIRARAVRNSAKARRKQAA